MRTKALQIEVLKDGQPVLTAVTVRELTAGELRDWRNREDLFMDDFLRLAGLPPELVDALPASEMRRLYAEVQELTGLRPATPAPVTAGAAATPAPVTAGGVVAAAPAPVTAGGVVAAALSPAP
jgi:hypothetical protein